MGAVADGIGPLPLGHPKGKKTGWGGIVRGESPHPLPVPAVRGVNPAPLQAPPPQAQPQVRSARRVAPAVSRW